MRKCIAPVLAASVVIALAAPALAENKAALETQNAELKKQLTEMRVEIEQMKKRLDAIDARGPGTAGASAQTAQRQAAPAASGVASAEPPPPGVTAPGAPMPPSMPPGVTVGSAVKKLMPGEVTAPTSLKPGYANAGPYQQGVIVPGLEGVPKVFIPDISAVGDFTLRQSDIRRGDARYNPADDKFQPRDTQIIFFSPIDPYTTAQISIDKPFDGPFDIEEAFLTFNKLPYDLTVRAGQFRPRFGLINQLDTFQLPMANRPQALSRYIGGDGFVEPGVNVSAYVPNPWDLISRPTSTW